MMLLLWIIDLVLLALLLLVSGIRIPRTSIGEFELKRRAEAGDAKSRAVIDRERVVHDLMSLQRAASALVLVLVVLLSVASFGWLLGTIIGVLVALEYGALSRMSVIGQNAQRLYRQYEPMLLDWIGRFPQIFRLLRNVTPEPLVEERLESRDQLAYLVDHAGAILTHDEKQFILHSLAFDDREVSEIMTPVGMIDSINKRELLGPLVLDDLHKTGHSRFPVTDGDIHHVVGMLYLRDLLVVDAGKHSSSAEKAMEPRVFYIREDQTLKHALAAFLRSHHHLFVVVNEFRETVGLLSLEDVIEALLGRKVVDEFDTHEDLRAVAARNPRANNHPKNHTDV